MQFSILMRCHLIINQFVCLFDNLTGAVVSSYLDNDDGIDIVLLVFGRLLRALWLPK